MKIRTGFVSNSSSSSFCIAGICEDFEFFRKRLGFEDEDKYEETIVNQLDTLAEGKGLSIWTEWETGYISIGLDIQEMKHDETRDEFEKRASLELEKILNKPVQAEIITDFIQGY